MSRQITDCLKRRNLAGTVLVALLAATPAWAQQATDASTTAATTAAAPEVVVVDTAVVIDPDAQAVLDRMNATLRGLTKFYVSAEITRDDVLRFGYKLQNNETAKLWVEKPNRLRLEVVGDIKNRTYVYSDSQLTMFAPDLNVYSTKAGPDTLGGLVEALLGAGVEMPLIDLLYHGNVGNLTEAVKVGILVGDSTVDGVATDHLAFRQPEVDWQLWVEKGANALPRKLVITTRYEVGDPQYSATLTWDTKPRTTDKSFKFAPPAGATLIPFSAGFLSEGAK